MAQCENAISEDDALKLLGNATRRAVLRILMNSEGEAKTIDDLARTIAAGPSEQRNVTIRLHHVHLPMLAEANLIDIEPISAEVSYIGDEVVEELLESLGARPTEGSL